MVKSWLIYVLVFLISTLLFYFSEHVSDKRKKKFSILAILFLSIIAGIRGANVGVDVRVYIIPNSIIAQDITSIGEIFTNPTLNIGSELLYGLLLFLCSRFSNSIQLLLFFLQLFTIIPIYKALKIIKKEYNSFSITLAMMVYMFLYYNNSLNMMRQSVAAAFLIYGVVNYLYNNKKKLVSKIIPFIIAILFHKSSIIGIVLVTIIYFITKYINKKGKKFDVLFVILLLFLPFIIRVFYEFMFSHNLINNHYKYYAEIFIYKTRVKDWFLNPFSKYSICFMIFICFYSIFISVHNFSKNIISDFKSNYFSNLVLYGYIIYLVILFAYKTMYGIRLSIFLDMFNIIVLPMCINDYKKSYKYIFIISLIICWTLLVIRLGWSGSNNYYFYF